MNNKTKVLLTLITLFWCVILAYGAFFARNAYVSLFVITLGFFASVFSSCLVIEKYNN